MTGFKETLTVEPVEGGFVEISEHRAYENGVHYRSKLYVQARDAGALASALERFAQTQVDQEVPLADGRLLVFAVDRSDMINLELFRADDIPHGGYDTLELGPGVARALIDGLRAHSRGSSVQARSPGE